MKVCLRLFFLWLCVTFVLRAVAQKDTATQAKDSLQNDVLVIQSQQLQQIAALRLADSVKRAELEKQLSVLKAADIPQRASLEKELAALQQRDSVQLERQRHKIDSLRAVVKGFPVVFFTDTVLVVYDRLGSFSPGERAAAIRKRIEKLADDYFFKADSLRVVSSGETVDVVYNDLIIAGVSQSDALWMKTTAEELANAYRQNIATIVTAYKQATSWQTILKEVLLAILVIAVLLLVVYATARGLQWIRRKITAQKGNRIKGITIKGYQLFTIDRQAAFLMVLANIARWVILLLSLYMSLLVLFSLFPWTKDFTDTLLNYFIQPIKKIGISVRNYLPNLVTIAIICFVFHLLLKALKFIKLEIAKGALRIPGFYADWAAPTYQIIRVLIWAFMLIVIFPYLPGSESPVFKGVSVFVGVLFTFGSAGALGNIVSGVVLTYMRSFKIGDRVQIGDVTGDVIEKSLLVTRIRTPKNEIISIPNSTVMSSHTINYSSDAPDKGLIIHAVITIGYDVSWRTIHEVMITAALETEMIESEPRPFVLQTGFDDFYVNYEINAYTRQPNRQAAIYSRLYQHLQDGFAAAGIEIMSPHYYALRDGGKSTATAHGENKK